MTQAVSITDPPPSEQENSALTQSAPNKEQKDDWETTLALMMEGLALDDDDEDDYTSGNPKRSAADRKRLRQLQKKPGWYRRVSRWVGKGTKKRIRELWPRYGIEPPRWQVRMDIPALFAPTRDVRKVVVDVGFGDGATLVTKALELQDTAPEVGFMGCEWHHASVGGALTRLNETGAENVRVLKGDFLHHLRAGWFAPGALDEVCVFFPDPWPKPEDYARRVINAVSVQQLAGCVKEGGYLHIATDVREYAAWVGSVMEGVDDTWEACPVAEESVLYRSPDQEEVEDGPHYHHSVEEVEAIYGLLAARPRWRPLTRYEARGVQELGHSIYDLCYRRRRIDEGVREE